MLIYLNCFGKSFLDIIGRAIWEEARGIEGNELRIKKVYIGKEFSFSATILVCEISVVRSEVIISGTQTGYDQLSFRKIEYEKLMCV